MNTDYFIAKDRILSPAQDYEFLRKEGMKYIEKYGSTLWTDYNSHDPGITILEALSYAITELGYRNSFKINDLLTSADGNIKNGSFFTASEIFTNAPLTETDYRKLLIDIKGVSNAWFLATQKTTDAFGFNLPHNNEVPVYINPLEDKLTFKEKDKNGTALERLAIRGLNKVFVLLEDDPILGNLNELIIDFEFIHANNWIPVKINPNIHSWDAPSAAYFKWMNKPNKISNKTIELKDKKVLLTIFRTSNPSQFLELEISCNNKKEAQLAYDHFDTEANICEVISLFEQKREKVLNTFAAIEFKLQHNRNLTEDYLEIATIQNIDIAVCVDIEINSPNSIVDLMAEIQLILHEIINPSIPFYTLGQMLEQGYPTENLFLGPKLTHGFLKEEEVEKAQLPTAIHASDILAALMQIKGITSVKNLMLTAYDKSGKPISGLTNQAWCLKLSGKVNPVFSYNHSKILLFKQEIPFLLSSTNQMLVEQKVEMVRAQKRNQKLLNTNNELTFPEGQFYQLDEYYSIQDEFPANYGLGKNKLSENVSEKRKAQVKQLKGYLHFYDQLLADFFNQLYHAKNILDTKPLDTTYFLKYLETNDLTGEDYYSKDLYDANFKNELLLNNADVVSICESKDTFFERRNRALDHLLARFGESFSDYVFMMYQINQDQKGGSTLPFPYEDLIIDKQNFINEYPEISSKRGIGINYLNATLNNNELELEVLWGTNQRGGYEKRVARLLGINHISLNDIVTETTPQTQWTLDTKQATYVFKIIGPNVDLVAKWSWTQEHILDTEAYLIDTYASKYFIYIINDGKKIAKLDEAFLTYETASSFYDTLIQDLNTYFENFYCLEHILLRPLVKESPVDSDLLPVCLKSDCKDEANNDPYSFKATIVLPGYLSRFNNLTFRTYAEKIFRQEAPAHVLLKICWVNRLDLLGFQNAYKKWLNSYGALRMKIKKNIMKSLDIKEYYKNHRELMDALHNLNTMYPEGNLYDCTLSEKTNPIILGKSALGTF